MARIAIVSVGILSHLNAMFELARRLETRGHTVCFYSHRLRAKPIVEAQGFRFFHAKADVDRRVSGGRLTRARLDAKRRIAQEPLAQILAEFRPDLWLVQSELQAETLWLMGHGCSPVLVDTHTSIRRRPGLPPMSSGYIPRQSWFDRPYSACLWQVRYFRRWLSRQVDRVRLLGNDRRSVWERVARANGVDVARLGVRSEWPYLYFPALRYLQVSTLELDFPAGQVRTEGRVGPLIYRDRKEPADMKDVGVVREFLAARTLDSPPLVLCVMGSILNLTGFYSRLARAAEGADFQVLVRANDLNQQLPANVRAVSYMPQIEALAHASVAIVHGGSATLNESIAAGVPMLVCSGRKLDENGNAARVAFHGLGLRASIGASPRVLRACIETLLRDPSYRQRVEMLRERIAYYDDDNAAVRQTEAWLE